MKKIMLCVAPVSAGDALINPRAIARDVYECYKNGAAMVHLHVRDLNGRLTPSLTLLEETVEYIKELCDIIIEVSTGGVSDLTIEERVQPCYSPLVEAVSLNVGSVNLGEAVYANPIKDVRYCVKQIKDHGKIPETELFELGMANTLRELDESYHFTKPMLLALVFGHPGEMPPTKAGLKHMTEGVYDNFSREDVRWGYTEAHRKDFSMVGYALDNGADALRIGFEDSDHLTEEKRAESNAELIAEAARLIRERGMETMTPDEARELFHIPLRGEKEAGTGGADTVSASGGFLGAQVKDVRKANKERVVEETVKRIKGNYSSREFKNEGYALIPRVPGNELMGVHTLNSLEEKIFLWEFLRSPFVKDVCVTRAASEEGNAFIEELKRSGRNVRIIDAGKESVTGFYGRTFIEKLKTDKGEYDCDLFVGAV